MNRTRERENERKKERDRQTDRERERGREGQTAIERQGEIPHLRAIERDP